jgi:hypothetical protein
MRLTLRSETNVRSELIETFVDIGSLFILLSTRDHQILYGRRGTGKTHAFLYLAEIKQQEGDISIYIDMRNIGSSGGIYSDNSKSISERATRLIMDTLTVVHDGLYETFINRSDDLNLNYLGTVLDRLASAITEVSVTGTIEVEQSSNRNLSTSVNSQGNLQLGVTNSGFAVNDARETNTSDQQEQRVTRTGTEVYRVHFGELGQVFQELSNVLSPKRIWILLDEWSSVPTDLQPYLADLIRRTLLSASNVTVKIAAIEQRTVFKENTRNGNYIGFELGADIAANLDLDDFMSFDNDATKARSFFQNLLYKHVSTSDGELTNSVRSADELVRIGFTQRNAFDEFVRSTEGVPRDAINIIKLAAQKAIDDPISIQHIRTAARIWYQRDKETTVNASSQARNLLYWIIDKVISGRRAKAFLLRTSVRHELIDTLFDARVLHVLRKNVSALDQPGIRYDAYKLDYGCYVDLINTERSPLGNLPTSDEISEDVYVDVPPDDYRAIRRAILELSEFDSAQANQQKI